MKFLATLSTRDKMIDLFKAHGIQNDNVCLIHLKSGKTYIVGSTSRIEDIIASFPDCFIEELGEHDRLNIQLREMSSITGNPNLNPFK